jgi:geranylgeranyl diphosphate synthase type II
MDIIDNKKTILMITALKTAGEEQHRALSGWLTAMDFDPEEKIFEVKKIFDSLGVKSKIEKMITEYYQTSLNSLKALNSPEKRKTELFAFAEYLIDREQ